MKRFNLFVSLVSLLFVAGCGEQQKPSDEVRVVLETSLGDITLALSNDTPLHRDNFVKMVKEGYYDGLLFHRVISNFMIQAGDPDSRHAKAGEALGEGTADHKVDAEIVYPKLFHRRGALAAAREGDNVNPERKSSGSHFYIVWGSSFTEAKLDEMQARLDKSGGVKLTPEIRAAYINEGGTPHLDGSYTVFGRVESGLPVVWEIQKSPTDINDRPHEDIRIRRAYVVEQ